MTIGELWATPRLWREYTEHDVELCDDAKAFHEEVLRRVDATLAAVAEGKEPSSGDRIRVVGYDTDQDRFSYHDLPAEYLSHPGDAVAIVDGEDVSGPIRGVHPRPPSRMTGAAERNDTSLAIQVMLRTDDGDEGHALLLGDLAYETITKIFDYSEDNDRPDRLTWEVLLAPHHCSQEGHVCDRGWHRGPQARYPGQARTSWGWFCNRCREQRRIPPEQQDGGQPASPLGAGPLRGDRRLTRLHRRIPRS